MMHFKSKTCFLLIILLMFSFCLVSFANSAEPPSITIIVPDAPEGLKLEFGVDAGVDRARVEDKIIEQYYVFYIRDFNPQSTYILTVATEDQQYTIPIEGMAQRYNNVYTLNLDQGTLTTGKQPLRSVFLISLRVLLTLIVEGLIFWLFGFRHKASWQVFLWVNLVTQGLLNVWINTMPIQIGYGILLVAIVEILILLIETIAFILVIKEHSKLRRGLYAFLANAFSLVGGMIIITALPI